MQNLFFSMPIVLMAIIAGVFTWGLTALGAASVWVFPKEKEMKIDFLLGIGSGIMVAASVWSMLIPALENCTTVSFLLPLSGLIIGGLFIILTDSFFLKLTNKNTDYSHSSLMMITAVTMHNLPEGMAVGVAFGAAGLLGTAESLNAAIMLTLGIGLQNFPEGAAVSLPLRAEGLSKGKSFFIGQLSAIVEPVGALIGVYGATKISNMLPFFLSFAAGAMLCVVVGELIPEGCKKNKQKTVAGFMVGFAIMMTMDVLLS